MTMVVSVCLVTIALKAPKALYNFLVQMVLSTQFMDAQRKLIVLAAHLVKSAMEEVLKVQQETVEQDFIVKGVAQHHSPQMVLMVISVLLVSAVQ